VAIGNALMWGLAAVSAPVIAALSIVALRAGEAPKLPELPFIEVRPAAETVPELATGPAPEAAPAAEAPKPAPAEGAFVIKRVLDIGGPIKFGQWFWDDAGVPDGEVIVTVDIEAQTLSVFRGGYEIGAAAILYGNDDKPTPLGTFPITQKKKDHVSTIYNAPMPYMQRLTNDGISVHGTEVEWGYATHGCVGVPTEFAAKLFEVTRLGDKVIITKGRRVKMGDAIAG
jgi:hypothetical protein